MKSATFLVGLASVAFTLAADLPTKIGQRAPNPVLAAREVCCTQAPEGCVSYAIQLQDIRRLTYDRAAKPIPLQLV